MCKLLSCDKRSAFCREIRALLKHFKNAACYNVKFINSLFITNIFCGEFIY